MPARPALPRSSALFAVTGVTWSRNAPGGSAAAAPRSASPERIPFDATRTPAGAGAGGAPVPQLGSTAYICGLERPRSRLVHRRSSGTRRGRCDRCPRARWSALEPSQPFANSAPSAAFGSRSASSFHAASAAAGPPAAAERKAERCSRAFASSASSSPILSERQLNHATSRRARARSSAARTVAVAKLTRPSSASARVSRA